MLSLLKHSLFPSMPTRMPQQTGPNLTMITCSPLPAWIPPCGWGLKEGVRHTERVTQDHTGTCRGIWAAWVTWVASYLAPSKKDFSIRSSVKRQGFCIWAISFFSRFLLFFFSHGKKCDSYLSVILNPWQNVSCGMQFLQSQWAQLWKSMGSRYRATKNHQGEQRRQHRPRPEYSAQQLICRNNRKL